MTQIFQYPEGYPVRLYTGVTSALGAADGSTLIDAVLPTFFTANNQLLGTSVRILTCTTASLVNQVREVAGYVVATNTLFFYPSFTAQVPVGTAYEVFRDRPILGGSVSGLLLAFGMATEPCLVEAWLDELGIDFSVWTVTNPATGVAWNRGAAGAYLRATSAPNANETARLVSDQRWALMPTLYGAATVLKSLIFEFEMRVSAGLVNLDTTQCIFGLTATVGANRATNNQISFIFDPTGATHDIYALCDDGTGEATLGIVVFEADIINWHKYKMLVTPNQAAFYVDEALTVVSGGLLPAIPAYVNFFVDTLGTGPSTIEIGRVKVLQSTVVLVP